MVLLVLGSIVGAGLASVIAILARFIQTLADVFALLFGLLCFSFAKKGKSADEKD